jgi:hypothetical protein
VAKASWRKNKSGDDIELRWFWVKGFPFITAAGLQRSFDQPVSGVDNTELDNGQPVRSRRHEYGCGKDGGVVSQRRTVVTLMTMRFNSLKN